MLSAPGVAIDLPMKLLIAEDAQGEVWISYNTPEYLQRRHGFSPEWFSNIAAIGALAAKAREGSFRRVGDECA